MSVSAAVSGTFLAAYDAVLARWPAGTTTSERVTAHGTTHVISYGPEDAPPVLLLPGGGATATGWYATAAALGRTHRVHAVDLIGEPGRSVPDDGNPLRTADDLATWLTSLLDALDLRSARLVGHSYGAWIALRYALTAPARVDRLVLLDPTNCFTGFSPRYLLRALPMLLRPTPARNAAFLRWETGGAQLDPGWRHLAALAADFPGHRPASDGGGAEHPATADTRPPRRAQPRPRHRQGGGPGTGGRPRGGDGHAARRHAPHRAGGVPAGDVRPDRGLPGVSVTTRPVRPRPSAPPRPYRPPR
jgi:pimeloyl-ACP methyl ester carboxylesterase